MTGSMAQYVAALEYYSGGKLPLVCTMYASSECYFGINLKPLSKPGEVTFTLLPNMCYFELLPLGETVRCGRRLTVRTRKCRRASSSAWFMSRLVAFMSSSSQPSPVRIIFLDIPKLHI